MLEFGKKCSPLIVMWFRVSILKAETHWAGVDQFAATATIMGEEQKLHGTVSIRTLMALTLKNELLIVKQYGCSCRFSNRILVTNIADAAGSVVQKASA